MVLPEGLLGWEAFRFAFSVVWPYEGTNFENMVRRGAGNREAVTTLFFIFGSPWVVLHGSRSLRRASAWAPPLPSSLTHTGMFFFGPIGGTSGLDTSYGGSRLSC